MTILQINERQLYIFLNYLPQTTIISGKEKKIKNKNNYQPYFSIILFLRTIYKLVLKYYFKK